MKKIELNTILIDNIEKRVRQFTFKDLRMLIELVICLYIRSKEYYEVKK